mgnify:FL=1
MRTAGLDELQPLLQSHTFHDGAPSDLASLGPSDVLFWGFSPVAPLHFA